VSIGAACLLLITLFLRLLKNKDRKKTFDCKSERLLHQVWKEKQASKIEFEKLFKVF